MRRMQVGFHRNIGEDPWLNVFSTHHIDGLVQEKCNSIANALDSAWNGQSPTHPIRIDFGLSSLKIAVSDLK